MRICGVDFETTGVDPKVDRPIEVGIIAWDEHWNETGRFNALILPEQLELVTPEIEALTGITRNILLNEARPAQEVMEKVVDFLRGCDFIIAHNAAFDSAVYLNELARLDIKAEAMIWACSVLDIPYDQKKFRCKKLSHLALDHGNIVDPSTLHRAMADVELIAKIMKAGKYTPEAIMKFKVEPWVYVKACIPKPWTDGGKGKDLAKADGYGFEKAPYTDGPVFPGAWVKRIKQSAFELEKERSVGFKREIIPTT